MNKIVGAPLMLKRLAQKLGVGMDQVIKGCDCELLYTEDGEILLVCHSGAHRIKVIGRVAPIE